MTASATAAFRGLPGCLGALAVAALLLAPTPRATAQAVPAGFQEYHVVGHEQQVWDIYQGIVAAEIPTSFRLENAMRSVVSITASTDNQVLYYDHWEDGFEADVLAPSSPTTLVLGNGDTADGRACDFLANVTCSVAAPGDPGEDPVNDDTIRIGDNVSLSSTAGGLALPPACGAALDVTGCVPVNVPGFGTGGPSGTGGRDPAFVRFDGGDRLLATGGPVAMVHLQEPAASLRGRRPQVNVLGGAIEMLSRQAVAAARSYVIPVGRDTFTRLGGADSPGEPFKTVELQLVAFQDATSVQIVSPGAGTVNFVLDRGQHYSSRGQIDGVSGAPSGVAAPAIVVNEGTKISTSAPIAGMFIAGGDDRYASRTFNILPDILHGNDYMLTAPGDAAQNNPANAYVFNPDPLNPITVTVTDSAGTRTLNVPPGRSVAYGPPGTFPPSGSTARLTSNRTFWGITAYDSQGVAFDWGHSWLATRFLGNTYTAPAALTFSNTAALFVSPVEDNTCVRLDFDNDGVFDQTNGLGGTPLPPAGTPNCADGYLVDALSSLAVFDPDGDATGARVLANKPVAVAYGLETDTTEPTNAAQDLGYAVYPTLQLFLDPVMTLDKASDRGAIASAGGTVTYTLDISAFAFGDLTALSVVDLLPAGGSYVAGSTVITRPDLSTIGGAAADPVQTPDFDGSGRTQLDWSASLVDAGALPLPLAPSERLVIEYDVAYTGPLAPGVLLNDARADGTLGNSVFSPTDSAAVVVTDIVVGKAVTDDGTPEAGEVLSYALTVDNPPGSPALSDVVITDPLPPGTTFCDAAVDPVNCAPIGDAPPFTGAYSAALNAVVWTAASVPGGTGPVVLSFDARINASTAAGTVIANAATVESLNIPPFPTNAVESTVVGPDLVLAKSIVGNPDPVHPGEAVTFDVTVSNVGDGTAADVFIVDPIPATTAYQPESMRWKLNAGAFQALSDAPGPDAGGAEAELNGGQLEFRLPALGPGQDLTFRFTVVVTGVSGQSVGNQATVSSATVQPADTPLVQVIIDGDAAITGAHLYLDLDGNGQQDPGEPDLANVDVAVTDEDGNVQVVTTNSNGNISVVVPADNAVDPGLTSLDVDETDPDFPAGATLIAAGAPNPPGCSGGKTDPQLVTAIAGATVIACDRGYRPAPVTIAKTSDAPPAGVQPGATVTYTVSLSNTSGVNQGDVAISDALPAGMSFVAGSAQVVAPAIRVTEYFLGTGPGEFAGTTFDLALNQDLQPDWFVIVQGSDGAGAATGDRGPDENYVRVTHDPFATGELAASGAANVIRLARGAAVDNWVGVVTVVESLPGAGADGFTLRDVREVAHPALGTSGSEAIAGTWSDVGQVQLVGGYNGAGCSTAEPSPANTKACHVRLFPSGAGTIEWTRNGDGGAATLAAATSTVMAVEWGADWTVQRARVTGNAGGNGADAVSEYNTAAFTSGGVNTPVSRAATWVWGSGHTNDTSTGNASEGVLIALGDGVNQNPVETTVAVGIESNNKSVDFEVWALTHPGLAVDQRFKSDGDIGELQVDVTVDGQPFNRMALASNGTTGNNDTYPRPMFSARYVTPDTVRLERRRSGENFPAWVQGIGFAGVTSLSAGGALPPGPASGTLASGYELPPGATLTVTFQARVDDPLAGGIAQLTNSATVTTDNVPGGVTDTVTDPVVRPDVSVEPNGALALLSDNGAGPLLAPRTATFTHEVTNTGDQPDSFALAAFSAGARRLELLDPATGVVLATDSDGDGTWDGAAPNTGTLAPGERAAYRLRVTLDPGTAVGSEDTLRLRAVSDNFAGVLAEAFDELRLVAADPAGAADVLVTPDHSTFAAAGEKVVFTHRITNNTGASRSFALGAISTLGYTAKLYRDTDGNGVFSPGVDTAISSTVTLADGAAQQVFVTVDVPPGAAVGDVDVTTVIATFFDDNGTPDDFSDDVEFGGAATDTITVSGESNPQLGFNLSGGGTQVVTPGDVAVYPGTLANTGAGADRYEFTISASVYADDPTAPPNQPDDGLAHPSELVLLDPDGNGVVDTPPLLVARDSTGDGVWDAIDVNGDGVIDGTDVGTGPFDLDGDGFPDFAVAPGVSSPYELRRAVSSAQGAYSDPVTLSAVSAGSGKVDSVTATTSVQAATLAVVGTLAAWDGGDGAVVQWVTRSEHGTVGFTLERLQPRSGRWRAVNRELVPGLLHSRHGGVYRLRDPRVRGGDRVTYRLVELEATGATLVHGPYGVTVSRAPPPALDAAEVERPLPGFERVRRSLGALADARRARKLAARAEAALARAARRGPVIEIGVRETGVYRLTARRLAAALGEREATVRRLIRGNALQLSRAGERVATLAEGDAALLFLGEAIASQYTRDNVYRLSMGRGLRMARVDAGAPAPASGQASPFTAHAEDNRFPITHLFDDPDGDYWMWDFRFQDLLLPINDAAFPVRTPHPAPAGTAVVTVRLHGALEARHRARIALGGTAVETEWRGLTPHTVRFEVDASALGDGETPVTVDGLGSGDPGQPSTFYINDVDITYPRRHLADGGERTVPHAPGAVTGIGGFARSDVRVLDVSVPARPRLLRRATLDSGPHGTRVSVAPRSLAVSDVLAFDGSAVREPEWIEADRPSNLRWAGHAVDWLLITSGDMVDAAALLAAHREGQGLRTLVVDVEDVYDEFAFGVRDADAIWAFLRHAFVHWRAAPRYVVLAGEGSFDYKDYLGHGDSIIPTLLAPTTDGLFPSDNLFADVAGNDFLPEMAIGRLPVIDAAELEAVANKLIAYESSAGAWTGQAVFGADAEDAGGDFAAASEGVVDTVPPGLLDVERLYMGPDGIPPGAARTRLHERLNAGLAFFNFFGHAATGSIGNVDPGLISSADLLGAGGPIANGDALPVITAFTCFVGQFGFPGDDGVGELLLVSPDRGAAAVFSPSGLSRTHLAQRLGRGFYDATFGDGELVIGEAILGAQSRYAAGGGDVHLLDIYNLLGDPATIMK